MEATSNATGDAAGEHSVIYRVTGTASKAQISYTDPSSNQIVKRSVRLPWEVELFFEPGAELAILARTTGRRGTLACEIWFDGDKLSESSSSGGSTTAHCLATVGEE